MPTPTPTPTPSPPFPTPILTPPLPSATTTTPLPEEKECLVVLSHSSYVDYSGYLHIVGELQNIGSQNTELNKVVAIFFDIEGTAIVTASNYSYMNVLTPGQKSSFEILFFSPPAASNYKLETTWQITNKEPHQGIAIKSSSVEVDEEGWGLIVGELGNESNEIANAVLVIGTFYNKYQQVIGATFAVPNVLPLKPGESCSFTVVVDPHIVRAMDTYSLQTECHKEET